MSTVTRSNADSKLTTADLAAAAAAAQRAQPDDNVSDEQRPARQTDAASAKPPEEPEALFPADAANDFRARWDAVQISFVDDPARAVRQADELVAQVMKNLADSFAGERARFEAGVKQAGNAPTETMRVALQRYRSFFQRLLSL